MKAKLLYWLDRILDRRCWSYGAFNGEVSEPCTRDAAAGCARDKTIYYKHAPFFVARKRLREVGRP